MESRRRGRPKKFDEAETMVAIQNVFWTKGYSATSLDDLARATGVNRPSLYATYGDKTSMYIAALVAFGERMGARAQQALESGNGLADALTKFYKAMLDIYFEGEGDARGCFILTTATAEAPSSLEVKELLDGVIGQIDGLLLHYIDTAQAKDKPTGAARVDGAMLAKLATGALINVAARARAGQTREQLDEIATAAGTMIAEVAGER